MAGAIDPEAQGLINKILVYYTELAIKFYLFVLIFTWI